MRWLFVLVLFGHVVVSLSTTVPTKTLHPYRLGVTPLSVSTLSSPPPSPLLLSGSSSNEPTPNYGFINLHQNENTSIIAVKGFLYFFGGQLTFIEHGNTRLVSFQLKMGGEVYVFDPNRIFTPAGIIQTLQQNGPYSPAAAEAVAAFAAFLLQTYQFHQQKIVVAVHNNSPNYSAELYLPGGPLHKDAAEVYIKPGSNPRNFFFVTEKSSFNYLKNQQLNVVLQSNSSVTDDGSLSVYAAREGKPYINCETAAEGGAEGDQIIAQLDLLTKMRGLFPVSS
jgi:hypothetical protein